VYSPYSLSSAFAMLSAGTGGRTLAQIQDAFHFARDTVAHHRHQGALEQHLRSRNSEASTPERKQVLTVLNDVWMRADVRPGYAFLDTLRTWYGGGLHAADFAERPADCEAIINDHVRAGTNGLIPEILPPRVLTPQMAVLLTNALYVNAPWEQPFSDGETKPGQFFALDGARQSVPMMHRVGEYRYASTPKAAVLVLPYIRGELELVIVLPPKGTFERSIAAREIEQLAAGPFETHQVDVRIPRFRVRFEEKPKCALVEAGVVNVFEPEKADFGPIGARLVVSDVLHSAVFTLNEKGTEAAAATAISAEAIAQPRDPPRSFTVDRPFLFVLRDAATGAVLFLGHVVRWTE